jgi:hypothetical protein
VFFFFLPTHAFFLFAHCCSAALLLLLSKFDAFIASFRGSYSSQQQLLVVVAIALYPFSFINLHYMQPDAIWYRAYKG